MVGQRVAHQPDLDYGARVGNAFRKIIVSRQPQPTDNGVVIRHVRNTRGRRIGYRRLALPIETPGGDIKIMSLSRLDSEI